MYMYMYMYMCMYMYMYMYMCMCMYMYTFLVCLTWRCGKAELRPFAGFLLSNKLFQNFARISPELHYV